jgi:cell fate (sporulation/competence/biofilm development) regulator YlbF (YheA/YmcA/DUF963 family)
MESSLESATTEYVKKIKETEIYRKYSEQLEILKQYPELYEKVNEFRKKNYEIQNTAGQDEIFDKMNAFEDEYERFRENPIVDEFLRAELGFCRLMQEVNLYITQALDFE